MIYSNWTYTELTYGDDKIWHRFIVGVVGNPSDDSASISLSMEARICPEHLIGPVEPEKQCTLMAAPPGFLSSRFERLRQDLQRDVFRAP
ncbi:MAG: hypothetical protein V1754_01840 [Pseudomonadota bacterium]